MSVPVKTQEEKPVHPWLKSINVAFLPGPASEALQKTTDGILEQFRRRGHTVQSTPDDNTDLILTTAPFGEPVGWRDAPLFAARRQYKLSHTPTVYTLVQVQPATLQKSLDTFEEILKKESPKPEDYEFESLSPEAYRALYDQGKRGGPILALMRVIQAQAKSIRVLLLVGDGDPESAYHFDLVGAYPKSEGETLEEFYDDIVLRIVTAMSTREVTQHKEVGEAIPRWIWDGLTTPAAMSRAGEELGNRNFFTDMILISSIVAVPAVTDGVASQYSEGCFSTWDPTINALIATVTGSARPVYKGHITEDDLAVIVGVREGGVGALVRTVEGKRNDPPSSEAVEMIDMDENLPTIQLNSHSGISAKVPVVRSKLHGHRGIEAFDPSHVEFVPLDPPFYHYLVSCATEAQARGIKSAFARSEALTNPDDKRLLAFTVLPGHGTVIAEKWVAGKEPFEVIWEYMDSGYLRVASHVPQGPMSYALSQDGLMILNEE